MNALIQFSLNNPWHPSWPEDVLRRFLTDLVSGPEMVLDLQIDAQRVAVAALLDKVQSKGNFANLEILGLKGEDNLDQILEWAKKNVPGHRSGFILGFSDTFKSHEGFASKHKLSPYYNMYGMLNSHPAGQCLKNDFAFVIPKEADYPEIYSVLCESFKDNLDTSIPTYEDWRKRKSKMWIVRREGGIVGFVTLVSDEISTVGVLQAWRGKGLAAGLIRHALAHVGKTCKLSVAVHNQQALGLYRRLGFREVERSFVYNWKK